MKRRGILYREARLGIKTASGLHNEVNRANHDKNSPLTTALEGMERIQQEFRGLSAAEIKASRALRAQSDRLFAQVGPRTWPDGFPRPRWLFQQSGDLDHPRRRICDGDFFFSSTQNKSLLRRRFHLLLIEKCLLFIKNHSRNNAEAEEAGDGTYSENESSDGEYIEDESSEAPRATIERDQQGSTSASRGESRIPSPEVRDSPSAQTRSPHRGSFTQTPGPRHPYVPPVAQMVPKHNDELPTHDSSRPSQSKAHSRGRIPGSEESKSDAAAYRSAASTPVGARRKRKASNSETPEAKRKYTKESKPSIHPSVGKQEPIEGHNWLKDHNRAVQEADEEWLAANGRCNATQTKRLSIQERMPAAREEVDQAREVLTARQDDLTRLNEQDASLQEELAEAKADREKASARLKDLEKQKAEWIERNVVVLDEDCRSGACTCPLPERVDFVFLQSQLAGGFHLFTSMVGNTEVGVHRSVQSL